MSLDRGLVLFDLLKPIREDERYVGMLTVLMATRNRGRILREVLESYRHLQQPSSGWKVVVVDNGSTDDTPGVLASFKNVLPLEVISEPKSGKNQGLNTGLKRAEGDLTVFTDDDVFPYEDWLTGIRKAADAQPRYSIFGGKVLPRWEIPPPAWIHWVTDSASPQGPIFEIRAGPVFTLTEPSLQEGPIAPGLVFGPNMAIRSCIFESGVRFDQSIGPRGSSYPMGSETELVLRLHLQGHRAWHVKAAVVEHFIRKEQLSKAWVLRRAIRFGRGWCRMASNPMLWLGIPRHLVRDVPKEALRMAAATILLNPKARFRAHWRLNCLLGEGYEAFLIAQERSARSAASIQ